MRSSNWYNSNSSNFLVEIVLLLFEMKNGNIFIHLSYYWGLQQKTIYTLICGNTQKFSSTVKNSNYSCGKKRKHLWNCWVLKIVSNFSKIFHFQFSVFILILPTQKMKKKKNRRWNWEISYEYNCQKCLTFFQQISKFFSAHLNLKATKLRNISNFVLFLSPKPQVN